MDKEAATPKGIQHELKPSRADTAKEDLGDVVFEDILGDIGSRGRYQRRFNLLIAYGSAVLVALSLTAFILAIVVPDHWCHVPGRNDTNLTVDQWKNLTLPRDGDSYSRCEMLKTPGDPSQVVPCEHGWEFDDTWFSLTIPSHQGWVCDDEIKLANALALSRGLAIVLGLLLPYIGDRFGRKPQFFLSFTAIAVGKTLTTVTSSVYPLFVLMVLIGHCGMGSSLESALAVSLELTDIANRSRVTLYSISCFGLGFLIGALLAWPIRNYVYFLLAASIPCFLPLLCYRIFPESPRWLISRGRTEAAVSVVRKIAETNGVEMPSDVPAKINKLSERRSLNLGVTSLVTNRNLFKNTVLLVIGKAVCSAINEVMMLNVGNLGMNPFLALVATTVVRLPGYLLAHWSGDGIGRRAANCFAMIAMSVISCVLTGILSGENRKMLELPGVILLTMVAAASISLCNLQSLEIHPTCIRQSAAAIENALVGVLMATSPYIVYLGQKSDPRYMYGILAILTGLGAMLLSFLPESMHEKLPETLEDASVYGKHQRYWSLPPRRSRSTT